MLHWPPNRGQRDPRLTPEGGWPMVLRNDKFEIENLIFNALEPSSYDVIQTGRHLAGVRIFTGKDELARSLHHRRVQPFSRKEKIDAREKTFAGR
jgi:hypothetical protein